MTDNLRAFLAKIAQDKAWLDELAALEDKNELIARAVARAEELDLPLSAADFEASEEALSEDELKAVAGGGNCACGFGGGGTDTRDDFEGCISYGFDEHVCACILYGEGWVTEFYTFDGTYKETQRCMCPMVGQGDSYD